VLVGQFYSAFAETKVDNDNNRNSKKERDPSLRSRMMILDKPE